MDIYQLIDDYFEGKTSRDDEQAIRRFMAQDDIPDDLKEIAPLLQFFDDEATALGVLDEVRRESENTAVKKPPIRKLLIIAAIAASLFAAALIVSPLGKKQSDVTLENYMWVNGKLITDRETIRKYAEESLEKMSQTEDLLEKQLNDMFAE